MVGLTFFCSTVFLVCLTSGSFSALHPFEIDARQPALFGAKTLSGMTGPKKAIARLQQAGALRRRSLRDLRSFGLVIRIGVGQAGGCPVSQVFCSDQCRLFAKKLDQKAAQKRADDKYRLTGNGKEKRRAQSKRRRLRIKTEQQASKLGSLSLRVGDTNRRPKKVSEINLAAEGLGVSSPSNWTQEYLTPNTVALIATTTYVRQSHV